MKQKDRKKGDRKERDRKRINKKREKNKESKKLNKRGGIRKGAGRPKGQGKYGEETKTIRVPISMISEIYQFVNEKSGDKTESYQIPLYFNAVSAGFPSPADDFISERIDLNKHLVKHPTATFLVRVVGDSMINAGINSNDILIVDRSIEAKNGQIVVAAINGELTVKRLSKTADGVFLLPENDKYHPIKIDENNENLIWGVVTNLIHKF